MPACGPPSSLSPENTVSAAPSRTVSPTSGSSPKGSRAPLPTSATTGGPRAARGATPTDSVKPLTSKLLGWTHRMARVFSPMAAS